MANYPNEPTTVATAIQVYTPALPTFDGSVEDRDAALEALTSAMATAAGKASPVDKMIGAFALLRGYVGALDQAGLEILAGASELIMLHDFHGKKLEALIARDAARARLDALA